MIRVSLFSETIRRIVVVYCMIAPGSISVLFGQEYRLSSPNGLTVMEVKKDPSGRPVYRMLLGGKEVVTWSSLGLDAGQGSHSGNTTFRKKQEHNVREQFEWPIGEDAIVFNHYNEARFTYTDERFPFDLIARVYDGSIAFRYQLSTIPSGITTIRKEQTSFNFTGPYTIYQYHHESVFSPVSIDTFNTPCDFPATLTNGNWFISVGEAANDHYTKAELKRGYQHWSLYPAFVRDSAVAIAGQFTSPWRTVSVSKTAIGLHHFSQLYLKLNPPPAGGVPAWIRPGKLIRAQLTTQSGLDCIDFAARMNFKYIMYDAGWYGPERSSDPTQVIAQIDLPKVVAYGKQKGIGVILYVNYIPLLKSLDTLLPLYKNWGIAGLKFGFVDGFSQKGLTWLSMAIRKVNEHGLLLNIHDNYKPTGLNRTYPGLLTQEGIRGDENSPDAFHTTTLPFTRFLAGAADFTYCYPNKKNGFSKNLKVSIGQQLALTVIYFSPLQSMFWYGQPNDYTNDQEIEFFKYVPTVWDESHYLAGEIGRNISVARRSGSTWFMGNAAGPEDWNTSVRLNFLAKGKTYTATLFEDDGEHSIRKKKMRVKQGDKLPLLLKAKTGNALMIEEVTQ